MKQNHPTLYTFNSDENTCLKTSILYRFILQTFNTIPAFESSGKLEQSLWQKNTNVTEEHAASDFRA